MLVLYKLRKTRKNHGDFAQIIVMHFYQRDERGSKIRPLEKGKKHPKSRAKMRKNVFCSH
jgi:hypothetical protein